MENVKDRILDQLPEYIILQLWSTLGSTLIVGPGQTLAALYTRRQFSYIAQVVFGNNDPLDYTLYHSRHLTSLASLLSNDLAEMNRQLCYFLFGHIYNNGMLGKKKIISNSIELIELDFSRLLEIDSSSNTFRETNWWESSYSDYLCNSSDTLDIDITC